MNLFELKEEKEDIEADIRYYRRELERLEPKVGVGAIDYSKEMVKSSGNSTDEVLIEYTQMSMYLDEALKKYDNITSLVNDKYNNFKKHNDYDKQIYTEKKLFKWSNKRISLTHGGLSTSQIYNIVNKIEDSKEKKR